jgi:hypothetical protein
MIVRMKGVKKIRAKGRVYYYHRKTMTRLPGQPGSAEFMAALDALNRKQELAARPGTLGGLIQRHRASPDFTDRAANTRRNRQMGVRLPEAARRNEARRHRQRPSL